MYDTYLEVINTSHGRVEDESHFKVVVVSEVFEGKRLVGRHQAVNRAVMEEDGTLGFRTHAVARVLASDPTDSRPDACRCCARCAGRLA